MFRYFLFVHLYVKQFQEFSLNFKKKCTTRLLLDIFTINIEITCINKRLFLIDFSIQLIVKV